MMLKLTKYTNVLGTFEAEWFTREVIPAIGTEGEEGYHPETTKDTTVRVIAYSGDQVALFRADVAEYGGEIDEALLAEIQAEWVPPPIEAKTKEQIIEEYQAAVQKRLDDFAQTRNYNGILSACTYAASTVTRFKNEGQYCVNVRDTTWVKCYDILDAVNSNSRPMPTLEQLMSELPILSWPN